MSLGTVFAILIAVGVGVKGGSSPNVRDASLIQLLSKHYSSAISPRTYWPFGGTNHSSQRYQEDSHRHTPEGISHNYASYPYGFKSKTVPHQQPTEGSPPPTGFLTSSQEYWNPSSGFSWNHTRPGYSRPYAGLTSSAGGVLYSNQNEPEGSHSMYQYQQVRPTITSAVKKYPSYYVKNGMQIKGLEAAGKLKYKTPVLYYSPSGYKPTVYPRVHKPYMKLKYPAKKTVYPFYRRHYQSPYQQYVTSDLRQKIKKPSDHVYYKPSDSTTAYPASRYQTTERMDESYPTTSEDYTNYNDTYKASPTYYETYEEMENTTSAPDASSYDETTTRNYYGDRIYMSTQVPDKAPVDKALTKNKYLIVRKTSGDDDIETIFE